MSSPLRTSDLRALVAAVGELSPAVDDAERVDRLRAIEELKAALAATQARVMVEFTASQRASNRAAGAPVARQDRGVVGQIALALRCSPAQASRRAQFAGVLCRELPMTYAELRAGRTTEWRAMLVARESAVLTLPDRLTLDAELAPRLHSLGDKQVDREARRIAYRLDACAAVERAARAAQDRRVGIRPAPDTMTVLSLTAPVAQGVAAYAALDREATTRITAGDPRSRGQIMADTLVARVTGQSSAADVAVEVALTIPADTLLADGDEPGEIDGYGPVPAGLARALALGTTVDGSTTDGRRWLRRLFTTPDRSRLVAMETRRREFTPAQRDVLRHRDRLCRTPWCGAPIRHADHVQPQGMAGPTSIENGQGLCEACNHAKQAPGWAARARPDGTIVTITPTGHTYLSPSPRMGPPGRSPVELHLHHAISVTLDVA